MVGRSIRLPIVTVIIGATCGRFSVLVGDRLTTTFGALHSAFSNKIAVVRLEDALLSIGYTGNAYIANKPTDDWLVSLMVPSVEGRNGYSVRVHQDIPRNLRTWLQNFVGGLRTQSSSRHVVWRSAFEIGVTGVRFHKGVALPYLLNIVKPAQLQPFFIQRSRHPQQRYDELRHWVSGNWGTVKADVTLQLSQQLNSIPLGHQYAPEMAASIMRSAALMYSEGEPTIGRELSTVIHDAAISRSFIEFQPLGPSLGLPTGLADILGDAPTTISPWIIGHQTVCAPARTAGGSTVMVGGWPIDIRGENSDAAFYFGPDNPT